MSDLTRPQELALTRFKEEAKATPWHPTDHFHKLQIKWRATCCNCGSHIAEGHTAWYFPQTKPIKLFSCLACGPQGASHTLLHDPPCPF